MRHAATMALSSSLLLPRAWPCLSVGITLVLTACSTVRGPVPAESAARTTGRTDNLGLPALPPAGSGRGGYYQDDGPGDAPPSDLLAIPDAVPKIEPYLPRANRPYAVFGKTYTPITDNVPLKQRGIGSWYGRKFHGQKTSSGELYDMYKMTAAHPTLPIPSYARVTNLKNGRQVIVRINDRGPFHSSRIIDVSYTAAYKLGYLGHGSSELEVERLLPEAIAQMHSDTGAPAAPAAAASGLPQVVPTLPAATPLLGASPATAAGDTAVVLPVEMSLPIAGQSLDEFLKGRQAQPVFLPPRQAERAAPSTQVPATRLGQVFQPPAISSTASSAAAPGYYLQFGAFSQSANAAATRERLMQRWPELLPTLEIRQNGDFYRIYSGPFDTRAAAAEAATLIENPTTKPMIVQP